jgi:ketosteroid isomerase-like protein
MGDPAERTILLERDEEFFAALVAGDTAALRELLAEDFVLVAIGSGAVVTRAELVGAVAAGQLTFPAVRAFPAEAVVRRFGEVGIVVGRTAMSFRGADGAEFGAGSRYTHVYARQPGAAWRLVSAQGTEISDATA